MAQQVKTFYLSSTPETHIKVKGKEATPQSCLLTSTHKMWHAHMQVHTHTHTHTHTQTHTHTDNKEKKVEIRACPHLILREKGWQGICLFCQHRPMSP